MCPSRHQCFSIERTMTEAAKQDALQVAERMYSVTELARELGVTPRTLRFYEDKGLIKPQRVSTTRVYLPRDRARMILILRGKQLGFSLREISEYLDLYDADPTHRAQFERLLHLVRDRIELPRTTARSARRNVGRAARDRAVSPGRNPDLSSAGR